jgi:hypothetical protein
MEDQPQIKRGDVVLHTISGLYYICENTKQERWMAMIGFYKLVSKDSVPTSYFSKEIH